MSLNARILALLPIHPLRSHLIIFIDVLEKKIRSPNFPYGFELICTAFMNRFQTHTSRFVMSMNGYNVTVFIDCYCYGEWNKFTVLSLGSVAANVWFNRWNNQIVLFGAEVSGGEVTKHYFILFILYILSFFYISLSLSLPHLCHRLLRLLHPT